ncbi:MAG: ribonuclease P protein component [Planctomycetes bacterium RBG_13_44_8b]|nr:MAG: ribonuclease P protein component [Planctomycetes bacterium RBG_13_44_8b]
MAKCKFPKSAKLTSKSNFETVLKHKLFAKNDLMTLYIAPNNSGEARFAVSVSSKITSASARNRLKRLAREAFRLNRHNLPPDFDYLLIFSRMLSKKPGSDIRKTALSSVETSFLELVEKGHRLVEKRRNKS